MSTSSGYAQTVDTAFIFIVVISVLILLGVTAAMIYFVIKYSRSRHPKAEQIHGNVWLEITWVVVPTLLVLAMFYAGFSSFTVLRRIPKNALVIKVTGQMWKWSFQYPNGKRYDTLYVPVAKTVKLEMKSLDVNHSFYIPAFRIKEDVINGKETYLVFTPDKKGSFDIACAEYCGLNHSYMYNKVHVISMADYQKWVSVK
ncbi:MAG: cytochrome c oxidase subunit II [Bacteroidota bacterium]